MVALDEIKVLLDSNQNLSNELKDNIYGLIDLFHKKYPEVSLDNLKRLLGTLKIEKSNKFINKRISKYNLGTNVIEFNIDRINEGYDMKHALMFELLNVITNNGIQVGFNFNNKFEALNAGYTEILTNNLVGNDSDMENLVSEVVTTNLLGIMVGNEVLFKAYFNNDTTLLVNALENEGIELSENDSKQRSWTKWM